MSAPTPYFSLHTFFLSQLSDSHMIPNTCHHFQASMTAQLSSPQLTISVSQNPNFRCLVRSSHWSVWIRVSSPSPVSFAQIGYMIQRWLRGLSHLQEGLWVGKALQKYSLHSSPFSPSYTTFIHRFLQQIFIKPLQKGHWEFKVRSTMLRFVIWGKVMPHYESPFRPL